MDFSKTLFRCSSLSHIMAEPREKSKKEAGELSEGAKTHLADVYASRKYGRDTEVYSKYLEKGIDVEETSITLYSRVKREFFKKNTEHLTNDFIMGEPDLFKGPSIRQAELIVDIKSPWDIFSFFRTRAKPLNKDYYWQLQGYMALTSAKMAKLAYCLVNAPEHIILDEERRLMYNMRALSPEDPAYLEACAQLRYNLTYDDIPMHERVFEIEIPRNEEDIEAIYKKVARCRQYLQELEETITSPLKDVA